MNLVGYLCMLSAWLLCLSGVGSSLYAGYSRKDSLTSHGVAVTHLVTGLLTLSACSLVFQFLYSDFANQYVWRYSNLSMPSVYKVTALWGGMDGSMLLWCVLLAIVTSFSTCKICANRKNHLAPWFLSAIGSVQLFFLGVTCFLTNPFRFLQSEFIPPDGNGLNPLLQNPLMAIHPPTLYIGFTLLAVPYALGMASLLSLTFSKTDEADSDSWLSQARVWGLLGWSFLTAGIVLGGHWAYVELGWGGFWAWDPVENASFLPWLAATAFLHSAMVQERKGMLRFWNIALATAAYLLTVFGTFLTRSGVVQSVHAFASTDIGWIFLAYLSIAFVGVLILCVLNRRKLGATRTIDAIFCRESAFLVNNLIFLTLCFSILWGVLFPILSEAVTGTKQTVGPPFFNAVAGPLFLLLIFLMAIGPQVPWREASLKRLARMFLIPAIVALAVATALLFAGIGSFAALTCYTFSFFVFGCVSAELHGTLRKRAIQETVTPITQLARKNLRRNAAHIVHLGVAIVAVAATASTVHKVEKEVSVGLGEQVSVGRYTLTLRDVVQEKFPNYSSVKGKVETFITSHPSSKRTLYPELRSYTRNEESTTEVALRTTLKDDLYLVLGGIDPKKQKVFLKAYVNPLQVWLWFGAVIMVLGGLLSLLSTRFRKE